MKDLEQEIINVLEHGEPEERASMLRVFEHVCGEGTARTVAEVHQPKYLNISTQD